MKSLFGNWASILLVLFMLVPILGISDSVLATERIYVLYSPLGLSIPVSALEKYATTGVINEELAIYQRYLPPEQLPKLRQILLQPLKISPVVASQLLNTPQGEFLLRRLAELIKTQLPQPDLDALRSALILAAGEPGGLNLLNLIRKYPVSSIYIDIVQGLRKAAELENLISDTNGAISAVKNESNLEAATIKVAQNPNLPREGKFSLSTSTIEFFDQQRHRLLSTDIYTPDVPHPAPVIVISHGLGLDSSNFRYLATHLASSGFVVVVPNHPSSDPKQTNLAEPGEFIDRPLDVKFILDQLESDSRFQGKLNLQQVGVFGQSFGGYTALALAGAKINFEQLRQTCKPAALKNTWNMSVLLQCRALGLRGKLDSQKYNLYDSRVKAAIAVNPITSSIFGQAGLSQIRVPVMIVGSSEDTVAPAYPEQILPFSWFPNSRKYLVMLMGATHFSTIGNSGQGSEQVALPTDMVGDASQAQHYINVLSLPFFQTYVVGMSEFSLYLNAAYTKAISSKSLGVSLIQSLSTKELAQALANPVLKKSTAAMIQFRASGFSARCYRRLVKFPQISPCKVF
jgi:predicted dienelactone hydrolase